MAKRSLSERIKLVANKRAEWNKYMMERIMVAKAIYPNRFKKKVMTPEQAGEKEEAQTGGQITKSHESNNGKLGRKDGNHIAAVASCRNIGDIPISEELFSFLKSHKRIEVSLDGNPNYKVISQSDSHAHIRVQDNIHGLRQIFQYCVNRRWV